MADLSQVPGVQAQELPTPPGPMVGVTTGVAAILGITERGVPNKAVEVNSWTAYKTLYGTIGGVAASSYMAYAAKQFFDNGGSRLFVVRVAHSDTVIASAVLVDRAGTPQNTLTVNAISAGAWANGTTGGLSVTIAVPSSGSANLFKLQVLLNGAVVETWDNLSMDSTQNQYALAVVNGNSNYITLANDNSATAAPNNMPALATTNLASGADGTAAADADFTAQLTQGTASLDGVEENLMIACPGHGGTAYAVTIAGFQYAAARGDSVFISDLGATDSATQAATDAGTITAGLTSTQLSYGALYYPYILVSDPFGVGSNPVKYIPPSGGVLGVHARIDRSRGVHKAAAGSEANLVGVTGIYTAINDQVQASLNPVGVNCIRVFNNIGTVIWGNRTLSMDRKLKFLQTRRFLNFLKLSFIKDFAFSVFEPNDETLWANLIKRGNQFLTEQWRNRALKGNTAQQAFFVKCDDELNTQTVIDNGQVIYQVGVNPTRPAETIILQFAQTDTGAQVTEA